MIREKTDSWKLIATVGVGIIYGVLPTNITPFQIGLFIEELGFSNRQSGNLVTIELMSVAIATLLIAPYMKTLSCRKVAVFGGIVALTGQLLTSFFYQYWELVPLRILTACGLGIVAAAASTVAGRSNNPAKVFSFAISGSLVIIAFFLPFLSEILVLAGHQGMFLTLAAFIGFSLFIFKWIPASQSSQTEQAEYTSPPSSSLYMFMLIIALFNLASSSAWAFMERAGVSLGLVQDQIGMLIGFSTLFSIVGSLFVSFIFDKVNKNIPLVCGLLTCGMSCYWISSGSDVHLFKLGSLIYWLSYMFLWAYSMSVVSEMDRSGQSTATAYGLTNLSFAMGPMLAGYIVTEYSYEVLARFGLLTCVSAAILAVSLRFGFKRKTN